MNTLVTGKSSGDRARGRASISSSRRSTVQGQNGRQGGKPCRPIKRDRNGLTRCRVCGCTEADACLHGCCWVEEDLCSVCAVAAEALADWYRDARKIRLAALRREVTRRLETSR